MSQRSDQTGERSRISVTDRLRALGCEIAGGRIDCQCRT